MNFPEAASADELAGITNLVHGNAADARELRANLAVFARRSNSKHIQRLVSDVLSGRRNVREVFRTKEFTESLSANLGKIETGLDALTDEERAAVWDRDRAETPQAALNALRDGHEPATTQPEPEPDFEDDRETSILRDRSHE
ncbi:MAG: hypothetical protein QOI21_4149 [Actinomycetota bacterium]|nr:hypothetical protein [Actinomycetota bacterium]